MGRVQLRAIVALLAIATAAALILELQPHHP